MSKKIIMVEVVSDIVCPWCWVGKRNLETAIKSTADRFKVDVRWYPFQLRPGTPMEGILKAPDTPSNRRVGVHMKAVGQKAGIDFTGKTDRAPNTLYAHNLLHYAFQKGGSTLQNAIQERLFQAYFTDGIFLDVDALVKIAVKSGLDEDETSEFVQSSSACEYTTKEARQNSMRGVNGVPTFIVNGEVVFSGGQPPESFVEAFENAPETKEGVWSWGK
eukprot:CFRG6919T1